mmetsp:Transcript_31726/g.61928  ORF Transcript_31726/g.61928 Transcript_31726/m.61928 type:complete len:306 (-) Transcript_31726:479-1396(-)
MGTGAAAPQTLRRGAHAFAITLLVILAWIPVGSDALSAKAAPKLAFAPPNQRLAQHVSRGLIRMASAAAAGVMCEVAGQATSPKPQLPTMQASLASDGAIATAVAPAQMLPVLSSMASAAAYRGTMALSYDSLLASMRSSPAAKVNLPTVMMAAAATGLASAIYISATRYRDGPQMRNTVCASPQTLGGGRTRFQDVAATFSHEAVEYAAFFRSTAHGAGQPPLPRRHLVRVRRRGRGHGPDLDGARGGGAQPRVRGRRLGGALGAQERGGGPELCLCRRHVLDPHGPQVLGGAAPGGGACAVCV